MQPAWIDLPTNGRYTYLIDLVEIYREKRSNLFENNKKGELSKLKNEQYLSLIHI